MVSSDDLTSITYHTIILQSFHVIEVVGFRHVEVNFHGKAVYIHFHAAVFSGAVSLVTYLVILPRKTVMFCNIKYVSHERETEMLYM